MTVREAAVSHGSTNTEFLDLSPEELIAKCRQYGAEAERLAETANSELRKGYLYLVVQWSALAEEIQNGTRQGCVESASRSHASAG